MFGTLIDVGTDGNVFIQDKGVSLIPSLWAVYKKINLLIERNL
jgi:hypothetical protein